MPITDRKKNSFNIKCYCYLACSKMLMNLFQTKKHGINIQHINSEFLKELWIVSTISWVVLELLPKIIKLP